MANINATSKRAIRISVRVMLLFAITLASSCTKPTVFPHYMTVADVINNVKCDFSQALIAAPNSKWLDDWAAALEFQIEVERETGATGELSLVVPYNPGLFTAAVGGSAAKSGRSRMTFKINEYSLEGLKHSDPCNFERQLTSERNLAGETGLRLWFGMVIDGVNRARMDNRQLAALTYNLEFVTTLEGNIKPSFVSTYPSERVFSGSFDIRRKRKDDNLLTVTLTPPVVEVPFGATDVGAALARIEAELVLARAAREKAKRDFASFASTHSNMAKIAEESPNLLPKQFTAAEIQTFSILKQNLEDKNREVTALGEAKKILRQSSAEAFYANRDVATERRLNEQLLLDAIRNIPRR